MDTTADWSILSTRDFFFSSRRRHTRCLSDWSSDVCSSDLTGSSHATRGSLIMAVAEPVSPSAGPPGDGSAAAAKREIKIVLPGLLLAILLALLDQLIAFRALQGLGAGGLMVGAISILGELVSPRERGKYMGYIMSVMMIATI